MQPAHNERSKKRPRQESLDTQSLYAESQALAATQKVEQSVQQTGTQNHWNAVE